MKKQHVKIIYIVSMVSGLETFVKNEIEALADKGHKISLLVTKRFESLGFEPRPDILWETPSYKKLFLELIRLCISSFIKTMKLFYKALHLRGLLELLVAISWIHPVKKFSPDIIHCSFGDRKFFIGYFIHCLTGLPLTVAIHAHEIYAQPNEKLFIEALKSTSMILTISQKNRLLLSERFNVSIDKINVIRLPVNTDFWTPCRPITVITIARYTPRKGWHELLEAAKILGPEFQFIAVGFGDLDIDGLIKKKGLTDHFVAFSKLRPEHIRVLMRGSDIFCLPSKHTKEEGSEGIPVVLIEAMASGLPVVTTNDGSIAELVKDEIIPAADVKSLVKGIRKVAEGIKKEEQKWNKYNREKVMKYHNIDNFDKIEDFFWKVINDS
jgi:glycosyltransferase involved in cell wall biosynthesis